MSQALRCLSGGCFVLQATQIPDEATVHPEWDEACAWYCINHLDVVPRLSVRCSLFVYCSLLPAQRQSHCQVSKQRDAPTKCGTHAPEPKCLSWRIFTDCVGTQAQGKYVLWGWCHCNHWPNCPRCATAATGLGQVMSKWETDKMVNCRAYHSLWALACGTFQIGRTGTTCTSSLRQWACKASKWLGTASWTRASGFMLQVQARVEEVRTKCLDFNHALHWCVLWQPICVLWQLKNKTKMSRNTPQ